METRERFARAILYGFESYFARFQNITLAAKSRFANADWQGLRESSIERINLYKISTRETLATVELLAGQELKHLEFWREARKIYADLIDGRDNFEIAETYFNSMYCAVFSHQKIRDEYAFVFSPQGDMPPADVSKVYRTYRPQGSMSGMLGQLLDDYAFTVPYEDKRRDIENIERALARYFASRGDLQSPDTEFQVLEPHFFRNKGAYIVGRIV